MSTCTFFASLPCQKILEGSSHDFPKSMVNKCYSLIDGKTNSLWAKFHQIDCSI